MRHRRDFLWHFGLPQPACFKRALIPSSALWALSPACGTQLTFNTSISQRRWGSARPSAPLQTKAEPGCRTFYPCTPFPFHPCTPFPFYPCTPFPFSPCSPFPFYPCTPFPPAPIPAVSQHLALRCILLPWLGIAALHPVSQSCSSQPGSAQQPAGRRDGFCPDRQGISSKSPPID